MRKSLFFCGVASVIVWASASAAAGAGSFPQSPGVHTLTYVSRVDESVQRYTVYLPRGFEPSSGRRYPLVFFGVGYGGTAGAPPKRDWADEHGWIFAGYDGRHTHHYYGVADADFDQVLHDEIAAHYPVDLTRVYFIGSSMGASGAFGLGFRHPDWFASVAGAGGFVDFEEFWPRWNTKAVAPSLWAAHFSGPLWQRSLLLAWSPAHTLHSGYLLAPYVAAGERDTVNRTFASRKLAKRLAGIGAKHKYVEIAGGTHGAGYDVPAMLEYFRTNNLRMEPLARELHVAANRLEFAKNRWARITGFFHRRAVSVLRARVTGHGVVEVDTDGPLREFELTLSPALTGVAERELCQVIVNSARVYRVPQGAYRLERESPDSPNWTAGGHGVMGRKNSFQEGPINHVFTKPFLIVHGTGGPPGAAERDCGEAHRIADAYNKTCHADIKPIPDSAVTYEMAAEKSLILVGTEQSNRWLARMSELADKADTWPLTLTEESISIQGIDRTYGTPEYGLLLIHPSASFGCYILAVHGVRDTRIFNFGCFMMFSLPDYVIFSKRDMSFVEAGLFDETWRTVRPGGGK